MTLRNSKSPTYVVVHSRNNECPVLFNEARFGGSHYGHNGWKMLNEFGVLSESQPERAERPGRWWSALAFRSFCVLGPRALGPTCKKTEESE